MRFRTVWPLLFALPLLTAAGGSDSRLDVVTQAAVKYAQTFEDVLRSDPAEGQRIGVTADDLATLTPVVVTPLFTVDEVFRQAADDRSIDQALVATDLWWVVLTSKADSRIVVTVEWPSKANAPLGVGLNWAPPDALTSALDRVDSGTAKVIWLPEDAPVVVGTSMSTVVAIPVANDVLSARLQLPTDITPVGTYTIELRDRLARLAQEWADVGTDDPGLAGGGAPQLPAANGLIAPVVGMLVVLGPTACLSIAGWQHTGRRGRI